MLIVAIRTDKPEAEISLYEGHDQLAHETWTAHRQLGVTIHSKLSALLASTGRQLADIQGIVAFRGPGSFTGLRIGLTVANSLAYAQNCPVVSADGENWTSGGISRLLDGANDQMVMPEYGGEVHITQQKK